MSYFTSDFITFFQELSANNNRDWFLENKKRYETAVKKPFNAFIEVLIDRMQAVEPDVAITPKDAIFRINRDIRFSADKTPYKTHMAAIVSSGGKKDKTKPGIYLQFGAEDARVYGGAHMLDKEQLQNIREAIASNLDTFDELVNGKNFKKKYGTIHGEEHKRLPKEFQEVALKQPLLYKKSFYYFAKFDPEIILREDLPDYILDYYLTGKPLGDFFAKAMKQ